MIDIKGIDKATLLCALHAHAAVHSNNIETGPMTPADAQYVIDRNRWSSRFVFHFVHGRPIYADLSRDEFNEDLYDQHNGIGAAQRAVDELLEELTKP